MFSGEQLATLVRDIGVTHVVTLPDSTIGAWGDAMEHSPGIHVIRVCREGEAWGIAGGLYLGGATPLVMIQCTGLFESGDALRNILHDWKLPILSVIGYRSYLDQSVLPGDTCLTFTEPILDAWRLPYRLITAPAQFAELQSFLSASRQAGKAGVALIAEGRA
ncbi:MAG TPA: thiamine pyrophosphate-binding protein [Gemmatimonadaceae bacterium]